MTPRSASRRSAVTSAKASSAPRTSRATCGRTRRSGRSFLAIRSRVLDRAGGVDEREVAEPLREVAEQLARARVDLLGEEADVVRVWEYEFHRLGRLVDATETRERLDDPERACDERAFLPDVLARTVDQAGSRGEPLADRVDRLPEPLLLGIARAASA